MLLSTTPTILEVFVTRPHLHCHSQGQNLLETERLIDGRTKSYRET